MLSVLVVDLAISTEKLKRVYSGGAQEVVARSRDGRVVRFPANILRPFVEHDGVHGSFKIHFDDQNRCQSIDRIHDARP